MNDYPSIHLRDAITTVLTDQIGDILKTDPLVGDGKSIKIHPKQLDDLIKDAIYRTIDKLTEMKTGHEEVERLIPAFRAPAHT